MESSLQQRVNLEKDFMENKAQRDQYHQSEMLCLQNKTIFEFSIKGLHEVGEDRAVYQPLGKAYLRRNKNDLEEDLKNLLVTNNKKYEEAKKMKEDLRCSLKQKLEKGLGIKIS